MHIRACSVRVYAIALLLNCRDASRTNGRPEIGRFSPNLRWKQNHLKRSAGLEERVHANSWFWCKKGLTGLLDVIPALPVSPFRLVRGSQRGARWRGNICAESVPPLCAHCGGSAPEQTKSSNHGIFTKVSTALLRSSQCDAERIEEKEGREKEKYCLPILNVSILGFLKRESEKKKKTNNGH